MTECYFLSKNYFPAKWDIEGNRVIYTSLFYIFLHGAVIADVDPEVRHNNTEESVLYYIGKSMT